MGVPQFGIPLLDWALALLASWGYLITFIANVVENLFVVGSFMPGETVTMAAGFVSSNHVINPLLVAAVAILGSFTGCNLSYWIGRYGGRPFLDRVVHRFKSGEERLKDAEGYFLRHGPKTILTARFAPGIKNFAPMLAGVTRMNFVVFQAYNLAGAAIYSVAMVTLGYFFGRNFPMLLKMVRRAGYIGLAVGVAVIAFGIWERRRTIARRTELDLAAEEAAEEALGAEHPILPPKRPKADTAEEPAHGDDTEA